jgi:hypothetical protein
MLEVVGIGFALSLVILASVFALLVMLVSVWLLSSED